MEPVDDGTIRLWQARSDILRPQVAPCREEAVFGIRAYVQGAQVPYSSFQFAKEGDICVDGSAKFVQHPEIAACSAAAYQRAPDGTDPSGAGY